MEPIKEGLFVVNKDGTGYLVTNKCERCGIHFFPVRTKCIRCLKDDKLRTSALNKGGRLYTYTNVYRSLPYFKVPYIVGYIDFEEERVRVFAPLAGCKMEDLEIGMEMDLVFEEMEMNEKSMQKMVYKFRPAKGREEGKL
jgi:uncharacterized OB-fold protein